MDPLGIGPLTTTFNQLAGVKNLKLEKSFKTLLEMPEIISARTKGMKVFVGGPGAWQFRYINSSEYNVDCIVEGEAEKVIGLLIKTAVDNGHLHKIYTVPFDQFPQPNEIPEIMNPSSCGLIEVGRGCPRGCEYCSIK